MTAVTHRDAIAELAANSGHSILMPTATSFYDVFAQATPWQFGTPHAFEPTRVVMGSEAVAKLYAFVFGTEKVVGGLRQGNELGPFCSVKARETRWTLDVVAADATVAAVRARIVTPADSLGFEIIEHSRYALVIAQHNAILGGHWLAYIDPSTIPGRPS